MTILGFKPIKKQLQRGKILAYDGFSRANNALTLGKAETGHLWQYFNGIWGIIGGQAYNATYVMGGVVACIDAGVADCYVECNMYSVSVITTGLAFRIFNHNNLFRISSSSSSSNWILQKRVEGVITTLADLGVVSVSGDKLAVLLRGDNIHAYVNGILKATIIDSFQHNLTKHGLVKTLAVTGNFRWDNFRVEAI